MNQINKDLKALFEDIKDDTWISWRHLFFSNLGVYASNFIRKKLQYNLKSNVVTVGFVITENSTVSYHNSTIKILNILDGCHLKYTIKKYEGFDYVKYGATTNKYKLIKACPYFPVQIVNNKKGHNVLLNAYENQLCPISGVDGKIKLIHVEIPRDNIKKFLIHLNDNNIGHYVQHILYNGCIRDYKHLSENETISSMLLLSPIDDRITFQYNKPCGSAIGSLNSLKIKCTNVLINSLSKKKKLSKKESQDYILSKQNEILAGNFVKINFRLASPSDSVWSFIVKSMDDGNVVPSMINWKDGMPQGGIVYCPVLYFDKFYKKLKLFNNNYINMNYYPYFHQ